MVDYGASLPNPGEAGRGELAHPWGVRCVTSAGCRGADLRKGMLMFERLFLMLQLLKLKLTDEEGATAVEYGIMVALIAAVIIGLVATLGGQIQTAFQTIVTGLGG